MGENRLSFVVMLCENSKKAQRHSLVLTCTHFLFIQQTDQSADPSLATPLRAYRAQERDAKEGGHYIEPESRIPYPASFSGNFVRLKKPQKKIIEIVQKAIPVCPPVKQNTKNMENRLNFFEKGQNAMKALFGIGGYLKKSTLDQSLKELIAMRVSQINKCAFCIDMHYKDARAHGETEQRLYGLSAWQESPYYTKRERAALAWVEGVNKCETPDQLYNEVKEHFTEEEIVDLTIQASTTGVWNRINISFQPEAGTYRVGQFA